MQSASLKQELPSVRREAPELDPGEVHRGCNVEVVSFNQTTHAEQNAVSTAIADGAEEFRMIAVYTESNEVQPPCGHCRQILAEFCGPEVYVVSATPDGRKAWTVGGLLPDAFSDY